MKAILLSLALVSGTIYAQNVVQRQNNRGGQVRSINEVMTNVNEVPSSRGSRAGNNITFNNINRNNSSRQGNNNVANGEGLVSLMNVMRNNASNTASSTRNMRSTGNTNRSTPNRQAVASTTPSPIVQQSESGGNPIIVPIEQVSSNGRNLNPAIAQQTAIESGNAIQNRGIRGGNQLIQIVQVDNRFGNLNENVSRQSVVVDDVQTKQSKEGNEKQRPERGSRGLNLNFDLSVNVQTNQREKEEKVREEKGKEEKPAKASKERNGFRLPSIQLPSISLPSFGKKSGVTKIKNVRQSKSKFLKRKRKNRLTLVFRKLFATRRRSFLSVTCFQF